MRYIRNYLVAIQIICMISVMLPTGALAVSDSADIAPANTAKYNDIQGTWFEKWAGTYGYGGVFDSDDGSFHPNQAITRMEFARMLHKALDININYFAATDIREYYDDVANNESGASALYDLVTCGIIDIKGSFRPSEKLERDEMIHFIMNAFYHFAGSGYAIPDIDCIPFADESEIDTGYLNNVYNSVALGLVSGRGGNLVCPDETATRAEAVTIAGRLAELKKTLSSDVVVKSTAQDENYDLILTLSILNNTDKAITINHSNGQIFDFVILDKDGKQLYRWSDGKMFTAMVTSTQIAPGEELIFTDKVDSKTYASIKDKSASVKAYIIGTSSDFKINQNGYYIQTYLK